MKYWIILLLTLTVACGQKKALFTSENYLLENCPEGYNCTFDVKENKSIVIKNDDIGGIYYELQDSKTTKVVIYKLEKIYPKNLADANYREEIVLEMNNQTKELKLQNIDLQKTKMLFGRFCYCKGQTGYYKVKSGNFTMKNGQINLDFKIAEVPQILSKLNFPINK